MIDRKTKRLLLSEYTNGVTIAGLATKYKTTQRAVREALRESGVVLSRGTSEITTRQRVAALDRKLAQARMELYHTKERLDKADKRVYQLESEFRRRGIPLP